MHTYDFQLSDVTTIVSHTANLGLRLNCGLWLAGYAAQVTFPPGVSVAATPLPVPLSDQEARACLERLAAHQGDVRALALPWGQLLVWLLQLLSQLLQPTAK